MRNAARGHGLVALRRLNTTAALRAPHRRSPQALAVLAVGTGLSRPAVEAAVDEPTERGLGVGIGLRKRGLLLGAAVPRWGAVTSVVVPEWSGVDLGRLLSDGTRGRTLDGNDENYENDVHLAVLAVHRQGAATLAGELGRLPLLGISTAHTSLRGPGARRAGESEVTAPARAADTADPDALTGVTACADRLAPGVAARPLAVGPEPAVLTGGPPPRAGIWRRCSKSGCAL
ncbi:hypothetical protein [Streptomyces huasconensis]|uniref:hypothetical protein n=1 Tax=Streptomyces huasconensis TaxID=1854574 RepID=UPI0036FBC4F9